LQKVKLILFLSILITGCSVIRKGSNSNSVLQPDTRSDQLPESIRTQNISANSFFIQKAEIVISRPEETDKFLGSIKYENSGKYLISIRSKTGIEAARIFISEDSIRVNDRINRIYYYGSSKYLKSEFGLTTALIPILFGDFVGNSSGSSSFEKCSDGKLNNFSTAEGVGIKYVIDCKKGKIIVAVLEKNLNREEIELKYSKFLKINGLLYPGAIEVKDLSRGISIKIDIRKIEVLWSGKIEFIPGKEYELIRLL
jgi:hypothetical protein